MTTATERKLYEIAQEIRKEWPRVHPTAEPYLQAMEYLSYTHDYYFLDSGESIVRYFLVNAGSWRGEAARRIKAELKGMLR